MPNEEVLGTVIWFDPTKGCGKLRTLGGTTAFLLQRELDNANIKTVKEDDVLYFELAPDERNPRAVKIRVPNGSERPPATPLEKPAVGVVISYCCESGGRISEPGTKRGPGLFVHPSVLRRSLLKELKKGDQARYQAGHHGGVLQVYWILRLFPRA